MAVVTVVGHSRASIVMYWLLIMCYIKTICMVPDSTNVTNEKYQDV